jgi:hypothetical protein
MAGRGADWGADFDAVEAVGGGELVVVRATGAVTGVAVAARISDSAPRRVANRLERPTAAPSTAGFGRNRCCRRIENPLGCFGRRIQTAASSSGGRQQNRAPPARRFTRRAVVLE